MRPEKFLHAFFWLSSFFCLVLLSGSACYTADAETALEIKTKSDNFMRKELKDFSATMITKVNMYGQTLETSASYYQKNNPDGKYFAKTESGVGEFKQVVLINKDGLWNITGNEAQKTDFYHEFAKIMDTMGMEGKDLTLDDEEKEFNNIPCYVIEQDAAGFIKYLSKLQDAGKGILSGFKETMKDAAFTNMIPSRYVYFIGKDDYFLYVTNSYNSKNELISSTAYKGVKLNIGLKDDFFDLPAGVKIKPAPSMGEMMKEMQEMQGNTK